MGLSHLLDNRSSERAKPMYIQYPTKNWQRPVRTTGDMDLGLLTTLSPHNCQIPPHLFYSPFASHATKMTYNATPGISQLPMHATGNVERIGGQNTKDCVAGRRMPKSQRGKGKVIRKKMSLYADTLSLTSVGIPLLPPPPSVTGFSSGQG